MKSDVLVILYAEFTAKPGSESQVRTMISGLAAQVRQEPGNSEFTVYRHRDNPRRFFVFEQYLDEGSFQAHIGAEYGAIFNAQLSNLIEEGESQLTFLTRFDPA
jgi:quinol monooxygenase YgiN